MGSKNIRFSKITPKNTLFLKNILFLVGKGQPGGGEGRARTPFAPPLRTSMYVIKLSETNKSVFIYIFFTSLYYKSKSFLGSSRS